MNEGKPRALRAVARCASLEEFIAGFARFAEPERLFVITSDPKAPGGPPQQFVIQLADGSTALRGIGEVVEQHLIPTGPEGKCGMWLRLVDLTPSSREVHRQLLERRARPPIPSADALGGRTIRLASAPPPVPAAPPAMASGTPPVPAGGTSPLRPVPVPVPSVPSVAPASPAPPTLASPPNGAAATRPRTPTIRVPAVLPPIAAPRLAREPRTPLTMPEATPPPAPMPRLATSATPVSPRSLEDTTPPEWESAATTESVFPGSAPPALAAVVSPAVVSPAVVSPAVTSPVVSPALELPPAPVPPPASAPASMPAPAAPAAPAAPVVAPAPASAPPEGIAAAPAVASSPLPSMRDELVEKARRMAGPSPHAEERAPGSPFQLPANPLAAVPDEALGYFIECTLFEQTDLAGIDDLVLPPGGLAPPVPITGPFDAIAPTAMGAPTAVAAPAAPIAVGTPPRALFIVAVASVLLGVGGGWLLFGRGATGTTTAAPTPTPTTSPAAPVAPSPPPTTTTAPTPTAPSPTPAPTAPPSKTTPPTPRAPAPGAIAKAVPPAPTPPTPAPARAPAPSPAPIAASPSPAPTTAAPGECLAQITTVPPGVHVAWGALDLGDTPVAGASVPCGAADVVLTHPRYERVARNAIAKAGTPSALEVRMQRPTGVLTLRSIPPGATFTVNGAPTGRGPATAKVPVWETLHVEATLAGYAPWRGTVKLREATGQVFARMTRAR